MEFVHHVKLHCIFGRSKNRWNSVSNQGGQIFTYCLLQKNILRVNYKDETFHGILQLLPRIYGADRWVRRHFSAGIQNTLRTHWLPYVHSFLCVQNVLLYSSVLQFLRMIILDSVLKFKYEKLVKPIVDPTLSWWLLVRIVMHLLYPPRTITPVTGSHLILQERSGKDPRIRQEDSGNH